MRIYGDSFGGLTAVMMQQEAMRQRALENAFNNLQQAQAMQQRRQEWQDTLRERALQNQIAEDYRNRALGENIRQFNESLKLSREAPVGRVLTPTETTRLSETGVSFSDQEWEDMIARLTKSGRLSLEDAQVASLNRRTLRQGLATEAGHQDSVAQALNRLPVLRSLREQQRQVANEYVPLSPSLLYNAWNWIRGKSPLGAEDFEPGLAAGDRRLSERALRLEPEKKYLQQDVQGSWAPTQNYPRGMEPTNRLNRTITVPTTTETATAGPSPSRMNDMIPVFDVKTQETKLVPRVLLNQELLKGNQIARTVTQNGFTYQLMPDGSYQPVQ